MAKQNIEGILERRLLPIFKKKYTVTKKTAKTKKIKAKAKKTKRDQKKGWADIIR